jgi:hypothetical protein
LAKKAKAKAKRKAVTPPTRPETLAMDWKHSSTDRITETIRSLSFSKSQSEETVSRLESEMKMARKSLRSASVDLDVLNGLVRARS